MVDVLQNALAKDKAERENTTKASALRETKSFIQIIHKFRDEALTSEAPPIEKVAIFDEAQRAWDENALSDFMNRKKGVSNFQQSEPEFLISIMDRHKDWSVIICLVGGGQEIYKGEAGIEDWFKALKRGYHNWEIYLSNKMIDYEYLGNSTLEELLKERQYNIVSELHLGVSLRSFRSESLSAFVKCLLDNQKEEAFTLYQKLKETYPVVLTRNYETAKKWVKNITRH